MASSCSSLYNLEVALSVYSSEDRENARRARDLLFGVQNSRKAREGMFAGLLDPAIVERKRTAEERLRAAAARSPQAREIVPAWDRIAEAQQIIAQNALQYRQHLVQHRAYDSSGRGGKGKARRRAPA